MFQSRKQKECRVFKRKPGIKSLIEEHFLKMWRIHWLQWNITKDLDGESPEPQGNETLGIRSLKRSRITTDWVLWGMGLRGFTSVPLEERHGKYHVCEKSKPPTLPRKIEKRYVLRGRLENIFKIPCYYRSFYIGEVEIIKGTGTVQTTWTATDDQCPLNLHYSLPQCLTQ